jgi:hypothetical protein
MVSVTTSYFQSSYSDTWYLSQLVTFRVAIVIHKPLHKSLHESFLYTFITILPSKSGVTAWSSLRPYYFAISLSFSNLQTWSCDTNWMMTATHCMSGKSAVFLMESALMSHGSSKSNKKPSDGRGISNYSDTWYLSRLVTFRVAIVTHGICHNSRLAAPILGWHISMFRGYRISFSIRNPYINRFTHD